VSRDTKWPRIRWTRNPRGGQRGQVTLEAGVFCRPTLGDDHGVLHGRADRATGMGWCSCQNARDIQHPKLAGWWVTLWADQAHGVDQLGGITEVG